jgi:hypothetical protein
MHLSLLEWIGRLASLVLAAMVTLSIIGAIAAIPSASLDGRFGFERRSPQPEREPPAIRAEQEATNATGSATGAVLSPSSAGEHGAVAAPRPIAEQWLEVIAYALLALVALGALAVLLLWRTFSEFRRIADRG